MAEKGAAGIIWMIVWALLLVFIAVWIASFVSFFYIIVYIFVPCAPGLKTVCEVLHRGLLLPYYCSDNFVNARDFSEGINFITQAS